MRAADRPLLFLDVDGVVNVLGATGAVQRWSFPDGRLIVTPQGVARRMAALTDRFDVVWATTWGHDAPEVLGPLLGIGSDWPVLEFDDEKWPAIQETAGRRRFAWVDDNGAGDVPVGRRPVDVAFVQVGESSPFAGEPPRGLVVVTDPGIGLDHRAATVLRRFGSTSSPPTGRPA